MMMKKRWPMVLVLGIVSCGNPSATALDPVDPGQGIQAVATTQGASAIGRFIPIGADYTPETLELFADQAIEHNRDAVVELRVFLPPFSSNSTFLSAADRQVNLEDAQVRADQLQEACTRRVPAAVSCNTTIPDIQIRNDARNADKVAEYGSEVDGVYSLGGDQVIAMEIVANTPLEDAMEALHLAGVPLGGGSAGAAIQSRYMIAGLVGNAFAWNGLEQGSVDLAYGAISSNDRGLRFGIDLAIVEQHAMQRGRLIRSLQAVQQSPGPKIGLGPDWQTGVVVTEKTQVSQTAGLSSAFILDQETYGSAATARYTGSRRSLSIRNVGLHLLPEGEYGYDLVEQRPLVNGSPVDPPNLSNRNFNFLTRPRGSAPLLIAGDLLDPEGLVPISVNSAFGRGSVLERFVKLAREAGGSTVVLAIGNDSTTRQDASDLANRFERENLTVTQLSLTRLSNIIRLNRQLNSADAILVTAADQQTVAQLVDRLQRLNLGERNQSGAVLLFDDAAAAAVGSWMTSEVTPDDDLEAKEDQASPPYLTSYSAVKRGLGLVPEASFEPRTFYDYRYGRLVQQVYRQPTQVAFGLERETALELTPTGAVVRGPAAVIVIDGRLAPTLEEGENKGIAAHWLILDTFTTNENVAPVSR
jgi:cyanophycinase